MTRRSDKKRKGNHPSSLHFSLCYATPRQDAEAGEIHQSTPPAGGYALAGNKTRKNKMKEMNASEKI